jgi:hypothetical protein
MSNLHRLTGCSASRPRWPVFSPRTGYGDLGPSSFLVFGRFLRARGLERFSGVLPAGIGLTAILGPAG